MILEPGRYSEKIELWPLEKLIPYDKNPKLHPEEQIESICNSIKTFGWTNPILVHSTFGIVAGHGQRLAAMKMQIEKVPVVLLDYLSIDEAKAYLLRDNKEAETGYNYDLLAEVLLELESARVDLQITGFSDDEISKILDQEYPGETNKPSKSTTVNLEQNEILISIGEYRFPIAQETYENWLSKITQKCGKEKSAIITEIKHRLKV